MEVTAETAAKAATMRRRQLRGAANLGAALLPGAYPPPEGTLGLWIPVGRCVRARGVRVCARRWVMCSAPLPALPRLAFALCCTWRVLCSSSSCSRSLPLCSTLQLPACQGTLSLDVNTVTEAPIIGCVVVGSDKGSVQQWCVGQGRGCAWSARLP